MSPRYFASCDDPFRGEFEARLAESARLLAFGALAAVEISRSERHSHKVGDIARLNLLNDSGSVVFGRPRADAQLMRDELGRQPLQKKGKDLLLALRQQGLPGDEFLNFVWIVASFVGA